MKELWFVLILMALFFSCKKDVKTVHFHIINSTTNGYTIEMRSGTAHYWVQTYSNTIDKTVPWAGLGQSTYSCSVSNYVIQPSHISITIAVEDGSTHTSSDSLDPALGLYVP